MVIKEDGRPTGTSRFWGAKTPDMREVSSGDRTETVAVLKKARGWVFWIVSIIGFLLAIGVLWNFLGSTTPEEEVGIAPPPKAMPALNTDIAKAWLRSRVGDNDDLLPQEAVDTIIHPFLGYHLPRMTLAGLPDGTELEVKLTDGFLNPEGDPFFSHGALKSLFLADGAGETLVIPNTVLSVTTLGQGLEPWLQLYSREITQDGIRKMMYATNITIKVPKEVADTRVALERSFVPADMGQAVYMMELPRLIGPANASTKPANVWYDLYVNCYPPLKPGTRFLEGTKYCRAVPTMFDEWPDAALPHLVIADFSARDAEGKPIIRYYKPLTYGSLKTKTEVILSETKGSGWDGSGRVYISVPSSDRFKGMTLRMVLVVRDHEKE